MKSRISAGGGGDEVAACSLQTRLSRESKKLTGARREILRVMQTESRPLTNKEIFELLPKRQCDLVTVYRSVQLLERLGMVKRFVMGDGVMRFAFVSNGEDAHRHHLVCTSCKAIVEIGECIVRDLEERVVAKSQFKAVTHRLEFFGVCPACQ